MKVIVEFDFPYVNDIDSELAKGVIDSLEIDLQDLSLDTGLDYSIKDVQT